MFSPGQYISSVKISSSIDGTSYLNAVPAVKYLLDKHEIKLSRSVSFFIGENGMGKSTLIEAIAVAYGFNPEGGTRSFNFSTAPSHSNLWEHITLSKSDFPDDGFFLRAESFYNLASNIDYLDSIPSSSPPIIESYGGVSLHRQSHGESFLALVQNRFKGNGLYILDEPEAALSPMRLLTLIAEISELVKNNSQFIIATHSPILMAFPGAEIFEISASGIRSVSYRETEHYQITKLFLDKPEKMLSELLSP